MYICIALSVTCGDSSPRGGNSDDRRQRRKQRGAVGAAASRMQAIAKQTLGAATRVRSTPWQGGQAYPERTKSKLPGAVVPCGLDSRQLDKGHCPEAAAPASRAHSFTPTEALSSQDKVARHARGSPSGGAGASAPERVKPSAPALPRSASARSSHRSHRDNT